MQTICVKNRNGGLLLNNYVISCCTPVDYTEEELVSLQVEPIYFHIIVDGKDYLDDFGKSISHETLDQLMLDGHDVKTSQISVGEYKEFFKRFLEEGRDVLHLTISSGISGTYNSACLAANMLRDEIPDRTITIVDSLGGSCGYGMLVEKAANLRAEGWRLQDVAEWIEIHRLEMQHYFFCTDLSYMIKGGRIPRYVGLLAQKMKICPVMVADGNGAIVMSDKIRTSKKAMKRAVEHIADFAEDGADYSGKLMIGHTDPTLATETAVMIRQHYPHIRNIVIRPIGITFSGHCGPGCVALFYWGKEREK